MAKELESTITLRVAFRKDDPDALQKLIREIQGLGSASELVSKVQVESARRWSSEFAKAAAVASVESEKAANKAVAASDRAAAAAEKGNTRSADSAVRTAERSAAAAEQNYRRALKAAESSAREAEEKQTASSKRAAAAAKEAAEQAAASVRLANEALAQSIESRVRAQEVAAKKEVASQEVLLEAAARLKRIRDVGLGQATRESQERAKGNAGEVRSIQQLEAEIRLLQAEMKKTNDPNFRLALSQALRQARGELRTTQDSLRTTEERIRVIGNESRIAGVKIGTQGLSGQIHGLQSAVEQLAGGGGLGGLLAVIQQITAGAGPAGAAIGAITAAVLGLVAGLGSVVSRAAESQRSIEAIKNATGATTPFILAMSAALQSAGFTATDTADLLGQIAQATTAAKKGSKEQVEAFKELGISMDELQGKNLDQVFERLLEAVRNYPGGIEKAGAANTIFGEQGVRQVGAILDTFEHAKRKIEEFGLALDAGQRENLRKYSEAIFDLQLLFEGIVNQIGAAAAPAFAQITQEVGKFIASLNLGGPEAQAVVRQFLDSVIQLGKAVLDLGPTFTQIITLVGELNNAWLIQHGATDKVAQDTTNLAQVLTSLAASLKVFADQVGFILKVVGAVKALLNPIELLLGLVEKGKSPTAALGNAMSGLGATLDNVLNHLKALAAGFEAFARGLGDALKSGAENVNRGFVQPVLAAFEKVYDFLHRGFVGGVDAIRQTFASLVAPIKSAFDGILAAILPALGQIEDKADGIFQKIKTGFELIVSVVDNKILNSIPGLREGIETFREALDRLGQTGSTALSGLSDAASAVRKQAEDMTGLTTAVENAQKAYDGFIESNKQVLELAKVSVDQDVESGKIKSKLEAVTTIQELVKKQASDEIKEAQNVLNRKRDLYGQDTQERKKAESEFAEIYTKAQERILSATKAVNAAAAEERSKSYKRFLDDLEVSQAQELAAIETSLDKGTLKYGEAAEKRASVVQKSIQAQISELEKQLQAENVGAEERIRLEEQVAAKKKELKLSEIADDKAVRDGKLKDITETAQREASALNVKKAQNEALIEQRRRLGADEVTLTKLSIELKLAEYDVAIRSLRDQISELQRLNGDKANTIQLEERLKILEIERGELAASTASKIAEALQKEQAALDRIIEKTDQSKESLDQLGEVSRRTLAAIGASFDPKSLDSLQAAIEQVKTNIQNLRAYGFGNLAGPYEQQLQDLFRQRDALLGEQREKELEESRRAEEEKASTAESIAREHAERISTLEESTRKKRRDLDREEREAQRKYTDDRVDAEADGLAALDKIRDDYRKRQQEKDRRASEQAEDDAREHTLRLAEIVTSAALSQLQSDRSLLGRQRALRREQRELERSSAKDIAELDRQASQVRLDLADAERQGLVDKARELRARLAEINSQKSEKAGANSDALQKNKDEQAAISKQRELEQKKRAEIEALAKKGLDEKTLAAEIESINARYSELSDYYTERLDVIRNGDAAELEELDRNHSEILKQIETARDARLAAVAAETATKERRRQEEAAREKQEYDDRYNEQVRRNNETLAELDRRLADELSKIATQRHKVDAEYSRSLAQIESDTKAKLDAAGLSVDDLAKAYDRLAAAASKAAEATGKVGSGSSGASPDKGKGGGSGSSSIRTSPAPTGGTTPPTDTAEGDGGKRGGKKKSTPPPPPSPTGGSGAGEFKPITLAHVNVQGLGGFFRDSAKRFNSLLPLVEQAVNSGDWDRARGFVGDLREIQSLFGSSEVGEAMASSIRYIEGVIKERSKPTNDGAGGDSGQVIVGEKAKPGDSAPPPPDLSSSSTPDIVEKPGGDKPPDKDAGAAAAEPDVFAQPTLIQLLAGRIRNDGLSFADAEKEVKASDNLSAEQKRAGIEFLKGIKPKAASGTDAGASAAEIEEREKAEKAKRKGLSATGVPDAIREQIAGITATIRSKGTTVPDAAATAAQLSAARAGTVASGQAVAQAQTVGTPGLSVAQPAQPGQSVVQLSLPNARKVDQQFLDDVARYADSRYAEAQKRFGAQLQNRVK